MRRTDADDDRAHGAESPKGASIKEIVSFGAFVCLLAAPLRDPIDGMPGVLSRYSNGYTHLAGVKDTDCTLGHGEPFL
jgi:hypothetical protein